MSRADRVWQDAEVASRFLGVRTAFPFALDHPQIMLDLLGTGPEIERFLDVGCGAGFFSAAVHSRWPGATALLVDFSEPMLREAQGNVTGPSEVFERDLMNGGWADGLGAVDAVVSGFAIHHLPDADKQRVYRDLFLLLKPGGWFVHVEHVASASPLGTELFDRQIVDSLHRHLVKEEPTLRPEDVADRYCDRCDAQANILVPVEVQCDWLRDIGFVDVDCYFKSYEIALFAGRRPEPMTDTTPRFEIDAEDGLTLRLGRSEDAEEFFALIDLNRDHIAPWMSWVAETQSLEDVRRVRRRSIERFEERTHLALQIVESGRIVGAIGLHDLDDPHGSAELGYWLDASAQGRGLVTRAARALIDYAIPEYGLHRVYLTADAANRRSIAVAERLGMRREGEMKQDVHMPGRGHRDSVLYAVLADEWKAAQP